VAEQRTVEESKNSATDELLSQFKVRKTTFYEAVMHIALFSVSKSLSLITWKSLTAVKLSIL
jgi:hypothetical protein